MSLDVFLYMEGERSITAEEETIKVWIREDGQQKEISLGEFQKRFPEREPYFVKAVENPKEERKCVYTANITHNLGKMASKAGLYACLWRPSEEGIIKAWELIPLLERGLGVLRGNPSYFEQFNPENGWGRYEVLLQFVEKYLEACGRYPEASVSVWR